MTPGHRNVPARNPYERLYQSRVGGLLWGDEPGRLVSVIDKWVSTGTVLDVGCGDGKNSLFLEQNGFRVLGVDASMSALQALNVRAAQTGQRRTGRYIVADVETLQITGRFDVLVSYGLYHCLHPDRRSAVHRRLQELVVPGGIVLFCSLTDGLPVPPGHFDTELTLPSEAEVAALFRDGFRLEYEESGSIIEDHAPLVDVHEHRACWRVARRAT